MALSYFVVYRRMVHDILLQSWVDPDLVVEHGLVFAVLDAHLLRLIGTLSQMHRSVSHMNLLRHISRLVFHAICFVKSVVNRLLH